MLNLAGNLLYSMTDIFNLQDIKSLKTLILNSPDYSEMSISSVPNYCSIIAYYFRLDQIDGIKISEESRELVKIAIERRLGYYEMRIQNVNRNRSALARLIKLHTLDQFHKLVLLLRKSIDVAISSNGNNVRGVLSFITSI